MVRSLEHHRVVACTSVHAVSFVFQSQVGTNICSETKSKTLEELDQVFNVPTRLHAAYGLRQIKYFINRYLFRRNVQPEVLYQNVDPDAIDSEKAARTEKSTADM
jgi:hypothetical protein